MHPTPRTSRRAATVVLVAGVLLSCKDEVVAPRSQPRAMAPMLSVAPSADIDGAIVQLPFLPAFGNQTSSIFDINGRRDVVGATWTFFTSGGGLDDTYRATVWPGDGSPPRVLAPLGGLDVPGVLHSEARAINDRGDVVGISWSADDVPIRRRLTLWPADGGTPRELPALVAHSDVCRRAAKNTAGRFEGECSQ